MRFQEFGCHPCVFTQDQIRLAQRIERAQAEVAQIADRGGDECKATTGRCVVGRGHIVNMLGIAMSRIDNRSMSRR